MVLGSHQFSRHANQRTHGSRTHRLGRRHLACATTPLRRRPIYRQWGIPPRPETAIASVARAIVRASMPRVINGGGKRSRNAAGTEQRDNNVPAHPKVLRCFAAKPRNSKGKSHRNNHVPHPSQSSVPFAQSAKQRRGHVSLSTTSFSPPADLKAVNAGNPRTFRREAPVTPPDSRWEF